MIYFQYITVFYLYSLIRVGQQGYQHVNKKYDSHDKKTSVEDPGKNYWREIHRLQGVKFLWYSQQRPAHVSDHRPPTVKRTDLEKKAGAYAGQLGPIVLA